MVFTQNQLLELALYLTAYCLVIWLGSILIKNILKKFPLKEKSRGIENAGNAIGILERIFTLTLVLLGEYTAITLVLTAKSVARFEDLKKRDFAEYYLIGTLSSILFALFVGLIVAWII